MYKKGDYKADEERWEKETRHKCDDVVDTIMEDSRNVLELRLQKAGFHVEDALIQCWNLCKKAHPIHQLAFLKVILPYLRPQIKAEEWSAMINPNAPKRDQQVPITISLAEAIEIAKRKS